MREAICNRLGISADNDLALLRAIGGECAGALSLVATVSSAATQDVDQLDQLAHRVDGEDALAIGARRDRAIRTLDRMIGDTHPPLKRPAPQGFSR